MTRRFHANLKQGLGALAAADGVARPELEIDVNGQSRSVQVSLPVAGPAAVLGLTPDAIRQQHPAPGTPDHRAGELAWISLNDPALPWSFSRTDAPFLGLIVVPEDTATLSPDARPAPRADIDGAPPLPSPEAFALMAHVEDPVAPTSGDVSPRAFSRLLCPQHLAQGQRYVALLVPLTEAGRSAGVGQTPSGQSMAWDAGATTLSTPYYTSWRFGTGPARGVEDLLRALHPVPPDGANPDVPVHDPDALLGSPAPEAVARRSLLAAHVPDPAPLDQFADLLPHDDDDGGLPLPAYGSFWAEGAAGSGQTKWFDTLNLDPGLRVMAGLGAALVRRHQEDIIGFLREDAGAIDAANGILGRAQLAMSVTNRIWDRLPQPATAAAMIGLAGPALGRIGDGSGGRLSSTLEGSVEGALADPALRRRLARAGPLDPAGPVSVDALADAGRAATRPIGRPGSAGVSDRLDTKMSASPGIAEAEEEEPLDDTLGALAEGQQTGLELGDDAAAAKASMLDPVVADAGRPEIAPRPVRIPDHVPETIRSALDPSRTVPPRIADRIGGLALEKDLPVRVGLPDPVWPHALVPLLAAMDPTALTPSLGALPPDGVMALQFDAAGADALMAGANHELQREIAWRRIPVNGAPSPLRRLFDAPVGPADPQVQDTLSLSQWGSRPLGSGRSADFGMTVLIRSPLLRRFPKTIVSLCEAEWASDGKRAPSQATTARHKPLAMGNLGEDCMYLAFGPSLADMIGDPDPAANRPGGFLVFEQVDDASRFGLGTGASDPAATTWNALVWGDLPSDAITADALQGTVREGLEWGGDAAQMAAILRERTIIMALHVSDLAGE